MTKVRELYKSRYGIVPQSVVDADDAEFLGLGKKAKAARQEKRAKKQEFKLEKIKAKSEGRALVASKGGGLAGLGAGLGGVLSKAAGALGFGGGGQDMGTEVAVDNSAPGSGGQPAPDNTKKFIIIGFIAIAVIITIVILVRRNKKAK